LRRFRLKTDYAKSQQIVESIRPSRQSKSLLNDNNYPSSLMRDNPVFRTLCHDLKLAATHQRKVIYETVMAIHGHPSPEMIFDRVRRKIPSISLATVYKNIKTFVDSGMLREVSPHHGSLRVEPNDEPHHHLVCTACRTVCDLSPESLEPVTLRHRLPAGFQVQRISVDVLGMCQACAAKAARRHQKA
jgi:Fe2+ or Zn2+ uptake regulation protein